MSDVQRPPDDELVSSYLDDEATPAERAIVDADPGLRQQVEVLRHLSGLNRAVTAPPDDVRERNLAGALAVFDAEVAPARAAWPTTERPRSSAAPTSVAPVTTASPPAGRDGPGGVSDLDAVRRRRQARRLSVLGAAAVFVLVVLVAGGLVLRRSSTTTSDLAATRAPTESTARASNKSAAEDRAPAAPPPTTGATSGARSPEAAPTTTVVSPSAGAPSAAGGAGSQPATDAGAVVQSFVGDLGPLTTGPAFRTAVSERLDRLVTDQEGGRAASTPPTASMTTARLQTCDAQLRRSHDGLGPLVLTGTATINGTEAFVLAYQLDGQPAGANAYRAFALTTTCSVLDNQTI